MYPEQPSPVTPPEDPTTNEPSIEQPAAQPTVEQPYQQPTTPSVVEQPSAYQPPVEQPAVQPPVAPPFQPAVTPPPYQAPAATQDPGKTLGIIGFVFAFVFLQLVGLPLSIIGFIKSRKAGFKNNLALAGIILNAVFLVISIGIYALFTVLAYQGVQERARTSADTYAAQAAAMSVMKHAEMQFADKGMYPQHLTELAKIDSVTYSKSALTSVPPTPETVAFYACGAMTGDRIDYWDYSSNQTVTMYTGQASANDACTLVTE